MLPDSVRLTFTITTTCWAPCSHASADWSWSLISVWLVHTVVSLFSLPKFECFFYPLQHISSQLLTHAGNDRRQISQVYLFSLHDFEFVDSRPPDLQEPIGYRMPSTSPQHMGISSLYMQVILRCWQWWVLPTQSVFENIDCRAVRTEQLWC